MLMGVERLRGRIWIKWPSRWGGSKRCVSIELIKTNSYNFCVVEKLIFDLDPNHDGVITEEEFYVILKYITDRGHPTLPPIGGQSSTHRSGSKAQATATMHMYEQDKRRYGALLPKTGVYFLPDDKVLAFLR